MDKSNLTSVTEFVFLAFADVPQLYILLFVLFSLMYLVGLVENVVLMIIIRAEPQLHTPMYFFLWNLSCLEICYTCAIIPRLLISFLTKRTTISITGCGVQMFLFICVGNAEIFLLVVMAYDRYVAVCNPLRYRTIMTEKVCFKLLAVALILSFFMSLEQVILIFQLPFCESNEINHFFCDIAQVLILALKCTDMFLVYEILFNISGLLVFTVPFFLVFISYFHIISAILKLRTTQGRWKVFSSCSSHLTFGIIQYSCLSFIYLRPKSTFSLDKNRFFAVVFILANPILTPVIYSVRNKDVKEAFRKLTSREKCSGRT